MKKSGRNIKERMLRLSILGNRISRIKHYRGHGVHSPYVYNLVRKVFMCKSLPEDRENLLYQALINCNTPRRRAIELQNLLYYCGAESFSIDSTASLGQLHIVTTPLPLIEYQRVLAQAAELGTTIVVLNPYLNREHRTTCAELIMHHRSTSVDNRGYIIFFNNHLPKQHYKL